MDQKLKRARVLICRAQNALGRYLADGERRDLLMDNTDWSSDIVREVVENLKPLPEVD